MIYIIDSKITKWTIERIVYKRNKQRTLAYPTVYIIYEYVNDMLAFL